MKKPDFHTLYAKAIAERAKLCKCQASVQSLACPIHAKQAKAELDREARENVIEKEQTLDFDLLGVHLLPKKHGYLVRFTIYAHGKRQTRFALMWQCGTTLMTTRHKFSIFPHHVEPETYPLDRLFHSEPESVSMTRPFLFHAKQAAHDEARRMIETQCQVPTLPDLS